MTEQETTENRPSGPNQKEQNRLLRIFWGKDGKNLRDWLQLIVIGLGGFLYALTTQNQDQRLSDDRVHEMALESYIDHMASLIFTENLGQLTPTANPPPVSNPAIPIANPLPFDVAIVARADTLDVLRGVDPTRKAIILRFLYELNLINTKLPTISLSQADLQDTDLSGADLRNANLNFTYLKNAVLENALLTGAYLSNAIMTGAHLKNANLSSANLTGADLTGADLTGADLTGATLEGAVGTNALQLNQAKSLAKATMPDGTTHP